MALPLCVGRALRENSQSPSSIVAASNAAQACWRRRSVYKKVKKCTSRFLPEVRGINREGTTKHGETQRLIVRPADSR